ncbi:MAG: flagellar hook-length control protein FliK, partial [Burkholderiales bacterium]|nr:flagellar hook-length control protein FliK [Burkholderiales bacterium]
MYIHPAESAQGYPPKQHAGKGPSPGHDADGLPEGLIRARVDALLADGQVRVSVAGRMLQFMPPRPMMPGEFIYMKVTARTPQLILQIADTAGESVAELSTAATLIAKLSPTGAPRPGVITATQPLLASPPVDSRGIPAQLARTIADSGLFYESHQAEWVEGRRTLAQLGMEPQFLLQRAVPAALQQTGTAARGDTVANGALNTPPEALPLVRSQLDALDSRRLLWSGELWPGQQAQWEILEDDEPRRQQAESSPLGTGVWTTRVSLDLPRLGPVTVVLEARGTDTRIRIAASATGSAEIFALETAELRRALAIAGVAVRELVVQQHPSTDDPAESMP